MIIYFGKLNLNSSHIYKVYKNEIELNEILDKVLISLKDGIKYEMEEYYKEGTETKVSTTTYTLKIKEKTESYVSGFIYKDATIYFKQYNEISKKFEWHSVISNESADFYLDVYSEKVGYLTANRFGYKEFLHAFEGIINKGLELEEYEYRFTVELLTSGMSIDDIKDELKSISNIQKLKIKIQPPNINDDLMKAMEEDAEETLKNFEDANIATKSILLTSSSRVGLNIESKEINDQLDQLASIHSKISPNTLMKNGYVEIEVTDGFGEKITTGEKKAVKKEIDNIIDFVTACNRVIKKGIQVDGDSN